MCEIQICVSKRPKSHAIVKLRHQAEEEPASEGGKVGCVEHKKIDTAMATQKIWKVNWLTFG